MKIFLVMCRHSERQREAYLKGRQEDETGITFLLPEDIFIAVKAHRRYATKLHAEGKLLCAGPLIDFDRSVYIFKANSLEEAQKLIQSDPFTESGLITEYKIHEFDHLYSESGIVLPPLNRHYGVNRGLEG